MKKYSKEVIGAVLVLFCFLLLGVFFTISDYHRHGDLSNLVWVGICVGLIGLILILGRPGAPDGGFVLLPLLLLAGGVAGCARPAPQQPAVVVEARYTYTDANGFEVPVPTDSVQATW